MKRRVLLPLSSNHQKADPEKWDSKAGRLVKSKKEETRQLNNYLDMLQAKVFERHRELLTKGEELTARKARNFLLGIETVEHETLLSIAGFAAFATGAILFIFELLGPLW